MPPDPRAGDRPPTRVVVTDGPLLVDGPVEVQLPDGRRATSTRPVTALCVCGNSRRYPFCDTSHRRRVRSAAPAASDPPAPSTPNTAVPPAAPPEDR